MERQPESNDERAVRSTYSSFLARVEAGERLDFETWLKNRSDAEELRSLHAECSALEARLERIAAETAPESLFFRVTEALEAPGPVPPTMARPEAGLRIGEYRLISRLGKGGMGEVWEAVHFTLQRRVALKLLDPERFTERGVRFFDREARAGARVHDPGIVAVHDAGEDDGFLWIDQELVEGGRTLGDFLREMRTRKQPPHDYFHRVARFVSDAARSMQVAHDNFVVHRDLKPQNILIGPGDCPKITDFGLARLTDEQSVSRSGDLVGTYQYMSPEQLARGPERVDHRTDVFSLGVVLYELITLHRPFEADSTQELVARILFQRERDPCAVRGDVPRELGTICARALQKVPSERYGSMRALADDLDRWLGGLPIQARRSGAWVALGLWRRRHPALAASAVVLGLTLATSGIVVQLRVAAAERRTRFEQHMSTVRHAGAVGDFELALQAKEAAQSLAPGDPGPALALAFYGLGPGDAEGRQRCIEEARALGFDPEDVDPDDPAEQFLLGLHHGLDGSPTAAARARAAFEHAAELAPAHLGALFAAYSACLELGDLPAAERWLLRYHGRLYNDDPTNRIAELMLLELQGESARALGLAREIASDPAFDPAEWGGLRVQRVLGRLALLHGELDLAVDALRAAVRELPTDAGSHSNLAVAAYLQSGAATGGERAEWLAEARRAAEGGLALQPGNVRDRFLLAALDLQAAELGVEQGLRVEPELWRALEERIAELAEAAPAMAELPELRSEMLYLQGWEAQNAGDVPTAVVLYEQAADAHPDNLRAQLFLAQRLTDQGAEVERVFEHLELGLLAWQRSREPHVASIADPRVRTPWDERFHGILHAWITWAAAELGDVDRALEAAAAFEEILERGPTPEPPDLLTYAEGLAILPDGFAAEHDRALEVVERYGLRARYGSDKVGSEILKRIDAAAR